jgi:hypothetical protein
MKRLYSSLAVPIFYSISFCAYGLSAPRESSLKAPGCHQLKVFSGRINLVGHKTQKGPGWTARIISSTSAQITFSSKKLKHTKFPIVFTGEGNNTVFITKRRPGVVEFTAARGTLRVDFVVMACTRSAR